MNFAFTFLLAVAAVAACTSLALLKGTHAARILRIRAVVSSERQLIEQSYRPPPLIVSYTANGGACNQLLGHINALAVGVGLNATLVTSAAWSRSSFQGQAKYAMQPVESMVDFQRMQRYWSERRLDLRKSLNSSGCAVVDLTNYKKSLRNTRLGFYAAPEAFSLLKGIVRKKMRQQQEKQARKEGSSAHACVRLELGNPIRLLIHPRSWPYTAPAARGLFLAPELERAAAAAINAMAALGHGTFNGAHLRIENDWLAYVRKSSSHEVHQDPLQPYIDKMRAAKFNSTTAVYLASGIFSYQSSQEIQALQARLKAAGLCGAIFHKEMLLPRDQLREFHSEQLAVIDLLVLLRASRLVGDNGSSFSSFAREYRAVQGIPKSTFHSISAHEPVRCRPRGPCQDVHNFAFAPSE